MVVLKDLQGRMATRCSHGVRRTQLPRPSTTLYVLVESYDAWNRVKFFKILLSAHGARSGMALLSEIAVTLAQRKSWWREG